MKKLLIMVALLLTLSINVAEVNAWEGHVTKTGVYLDRDADIINYSYLNVCVWEQNANSTSSISYQVLSSNYTVLEGKNYVGYVTNRKYWYHLNWVSGYNRKVYYIVPSGSTMSAVPTFAGTYGD